MERSKDPIDRTGLAAALARRACLLASSWRPVQRLGRAVSAGHGAISAMRANVDKLATQFHNLTLFNFEGAALPSIGIFANPAGVCERYAPDSSPCVVG